MSALSRVLQLSLWLGASTSAALAATAGAFADGGNTQVSAMMMFVGNDEKVYILDKAESNAAQINGHPAWGAVWDINTHQTNLMDVRTNVFCAGGMHLPNGSYVTFGGNKAIGPGDSKSSDGQDLFDNRLGVYDGRNAIRLVDPCTSSDDWSSSKCQWFDDPSVLAMQKQRWYAAAEPLGDGSIAIIGGYTNGGYINRNYPNDDPATSHGGSEPTYEFFPSNGREAKVMQFMIKTSGLNSYAHTYLMPSGKMFVQANYSTILWEPETNVETDLPDMPNQIVRVYPASGATAMLPLTPANNYNPTILFCGGIYMPDEAWGDFSFPRVNTWEIPASRDCQRITPEPTDGSSPTYVKDDDMLETRTMGQFVTLPDGKLLVVNGAFNGTAGYAQATGQTKLYGDMPYGMSLASGPAETPAVYDPNAEPGQRWSNQGFEASSIPRLYHSTAILLPDASVLIAGSNPNVDVNTSTIFPTEYRAEIFYPSYFSASTRPVPSGIPTTLTYGGNSFDITVPASSFSGDANRAAENTHVSVVRPGWTTHSMTMGQRYLQLNNTYTVNEDGSITLHTAQMPPNANIFQPGPAWVFVVVNGIPSNGTYVTVGSGKIEQQTLSAASSLPASQRREGATGSADGSTTGGNNGGVTLSAGINVALSAVLAFLALVINL
ncbi:glyoxal oxidase [Moniliophthora roreri MCA 2997]|uniref:Glyoxal oxidase n=2 Tax=Moniliophthora roreri TaxID=221103 RepID=V2XD12_MONRO|nr:glyoxal oxidase [Moniliophthora roreri MCA 2997]